MKQFVLSVAVIASLSGAATAADMPVKARPMAPAPVVANWTGCYIGAGGGYGMFNHEHLPYFQTLATPMATTPNTIGGRGWFGTVQVGCDYQFAPRWVVGAFADYDFGGPKGRFISASPTSLPSIVTGEEKQRDAWAVGARVGYLVMPNLLAYVAGGYTEARFGQIDLVSRVNGRDLDAFLTGQTYKGFFIGTGYEYALDFLPGLFWKTEYRYSEYRSETLAYFQSGFARNEYETSKRYAHGVRSELVWRFNFGGPVVARY